MDSKTQKLIEYYFNCKDKYFQARFKAFEDAQKRGSSCCSGCDDEYFDWENAEIALRKHLGIKQFEMDVDDKKNVATNI